MSKGKHHHSLMLSNEGHRWRLRIIPSFTSSLWKLQLLKYTIDHPYQNDRWSTHAEKLIWLKTILIKFHWTLKVLFGGSLCVLYSSLKFSRTEKKDVRVDFEICWWRLIDIMFINIYLYPEIFPVNFITYIYMIERLMHLLLSTF